MKCAATVVTVLCWLLLPLGAAVGGVEDDAPAPLWQRAREALSVDRVDIEQVEVPPAAAGGQLAVPVKIGGAARTLVLWPHSLRAPDFRVMTRGADGQLKPAPVPAPCTYRGRLAEQPEAQVAATV